MTDSEINSPSDAGGYSDEHAMAGLDAKLPALDVFANQFPAYVIEIDHPEFTSICPKTGLPDFGTLTIEYEPDSSCLELKSLKLYLNGYRNLGIFQENIVNRVLRDIVDAADPAWCEVRGEFTARGGLSTTVTAGYQRDDD